MDDVKDYPPYLDYPKPRKTMTNADRIRPSEERNRQKMELKPCPFCGGKPYLETRHRAFIQAQTTRVAFVRCTECNARTQRFELQSFGCTSYSEEANKRAIEAWNRRMSDD